MENVTLRGMVAAGFRLVSVVLLIAATVLTCLEVIVLTTVSPLDPQRAAQLLLLIAVVPVVWAIVALRAASHVLDGGSASIR